MESLSHRGKRGSATGASRASATGERAGVRGSVEDEFADGFVGDSHVGAELMYGEELVFRFVEGSFDFQDQVAAVACVLMWVLCCWEPCQGFKP
ncbi:MAG: hypothetical protein L6264_00605 [Weeksellaceae bacterium]|nr:hypothetical protein [Weeksellaceae bacterium]